MRTEHLPELQLRQRNLHFVPSAGLGYWSVGGYRFCTASVDGSYNLPLPQKPDFPERQSRELGLQTVSNDQT